MRITCRTVERTDAHGFTRTAIVVDPNASIDLVDAHGVFIGRILVTFPDGGVAEVDVATGEKKSAAHSSSVFRYRR